MSEYHRHDDGQVVPGEAARCIDPDAGARDVIVLPSQGLGQRLADLLQEHWPDARVNPWLLADLLREES